MSFDAFVKPILDAAAKGWSAIRDSNRSAERAKFERGKQEFLMQLVTKARTANAPNLGFTPNPGTLAFEYSEALVQDGFLEREILTGTYYLKGIAAGTLHNAWPAA
jgi:hypothetical protein